MKHRAFSNLVLGIVLIGGAILASRLLPDWRWSHHPVHAVVEGVGAFIALIVASLIVLLRHYKRISVDHLWVASALAGMGVLDGLHASTHAGQAFVFLHSSATLVGGVLFVLVWLPDRATEKLGSTRLPIFVGLAAALFGILSIIYPTLSPVMVLEGGFTPAARFFNVFGGICFLVASAYFTFHGEENDGRKNIILSNHCFLFGLSGIIFEFSSLWDASWWLWHSLRLIAYLVVLYYFFLLLSRFMSELQSARDEANSATRVKSTFLASVSHELRTPLNAVMGYGELLLDEDGDPLSEEQKSFMHSIVRSARHLFDLINQVLDLTKIEAGELDTNFSKIDAHQLVQECSQNFAERIAEGQLTLLDETVNSDLSPVWSDADRMRQIVTQLLSNAVKFTAPGGTIKVMLRDTNTGRLRVEVTDTGVGIDPSEHARIFVPFDRLGQEAGRAAGAGIGLTVAKQTIEHLGGAIGFESEKGDGSRFWIDIPFAET